MSESQPAKRTVLVVDDDPDIVRLLYELLTRRGFHVVHTTTPFGVGALTKRHDPAMLILDVMMPGLDGESIARLISEAGSSRPVLFYSAVPEAQLLELIGRVPNSTYLPKGTPLAEILETVERTLRMFTRT